MPGNVRILILFGVPVSLLAGTGYSPKGFSHSRAFMYLFDN